MTYLRVRYEVGGGHVHYDLFTGPNRDHLGCNVIGACMTLEEFADFKAFMLAADTAPATKARRMRVDFIDKAAP